MPIDDFISGLVEVGGQGKGWKSPVAIGGLVLGLVAGAYLGWVLEGTVGLATGIPVGGLLGWVFGLFLRGFFGFFVIFIVVALLVAGYTWVTGGFS
ncbi:hypothetical protein [Maritimibacter dapengensis]|uniref:Uncharacterized protein n=1 Tax=Maritimibacter dapengensis TaxID=2836868 RepID=A0ABS6T3I7_9RHOB|nr:hypothetical protein [Maritimibacter dapengensis]MBV7379111.1 hypothetical protein [Maritimibacter dapengensis]